ncbi:MAG: hypothetical protein ACRC2R_06715 [Xenococcaceae cyanobacterium]
MVTSTKTIRSARGNKTASSKSNAKVQQSINGKKSSSENATTAEQLAKRIIAGTKKIYGVDLLVWFLSLDFKLQNHLQM